jgi:hypothetical protein
LVPASRSWGLERDRGDDRGGSSSARASDPRGRQQSATVDSSHPSPADTLVDKADAERVATEKASSKVEKSGILIPAGQFSSFCDLVSTSATLEVWDCSVSHSQCSGTVTLTFTESRLADVKNDVFCKE